MQCIHMLARAIPQPLRATLHAHCNVHGTVCTKRCVDSTVPSRVAVLRGIGRAIQLVPKPTCASDSLVDMCMATGEESLMHGVC